MLTILIPAGSKNHLQKRAVALVLLHLCPQFIGIGHELLSLVFAASGLALTKYSRPRLSDPTHYAGLRKRVPASVFRSLPGELDA